MPPRVIGEQVKPRALILGFDEATAKRIGMLFGSWKPIEELAEVEQQEWDVLVTARSAVHAEYHLYVISAGGETSQSSFHSLSEPDNVL